MNNNPVRSTDPTGHCGIGVILGLFGFSYSCPEPLDLGSLIDINVPVKDDNKPDINVPLPPDTESGWIQDPPEPWDDNPFIIDPPEKGDDVPEGYDPVPGNEHEFALLAKKPDIKWIDYIQWKYGLTADQREWLHQQMRRHGLTAEEIEQEAQDLQRQNEEDTEDEEDIDDSAA